MVEMFGLDIAEEVDSCTECVTDSDGPRVPVVSFEIGGSRPRLCRRCATVYRDALTAWLGDGTQAADVSEECGICGPYAPKHAGGPLFHLQRQKP